MLTDCCNAVGGIRYGSDSEEAARGAARGAARHAAGGPSNSKAVFAVDGEKTGEGDG
jgi:hypothetical protein